MMRAWDVATATLTTLSRAGSGYAVGPLGPRPAELLALWEFEACPFCRRVREALSILDLDALVHPCPKQGRRFRDEVVRRGGKAQFPYLVDPNTGKEMYESAEIVDYLFAQYGAGPPPRALSRSGLATVAVVASGLIRGTAGSRARPSRSPARPLELYGFEASPFCRLVREELCELELPYRLRNVAKGSPRREALAARTGKIQVPFLVDPNPDREVALFESADIIAYLERTYAC